MKVNIQDAINEYHKMIASMHMDMHTFHANWHMKHKEPPKPVDTDPGWGTTIPFGNDFLQMHHEMVKAADNEPKQFMKGHPSIASWFHSMNYDLPAEWNPMDPIPAELDFIPQKPDLKRITNDPKFQLPGYFTIKGINPGEKPDAITGAAKLSDFKNANQLGCRIIYPHNEWHRAIGGAMMWASTAIDDPIFYFGVHWEIDKIFDEFKSIPRPMPQKRRLTDEERAQLVSAEEAGLQIWFK